MKLLESARHQFIFWERLAVKFPANAQCQRGRKHAYDMGTITLTPFSDRRNLK